MCEHPRLDPTINIIITHSYIVLKKIYSNTQYRNIKDIIIHNIRISRKVAQYLFPAKVGTYTDR